MDGWTFELPADLTAPRRARALLRHLLPEQGVLDEEALDSAAIVVSELVTNALLHGAARTVVMLEVALAPDAVRLAVRDPAPGIPRQRGALRDEEHGRGLAIVQRLSTSWGVEPSEDGKRVFAELAVGARCA